MIKVGVIGFGRLGKIHAETVFNSNTGSLVAVCDPNTDARLEAKSKYRVDTFEDIDSFLASEIEAVVIASSTPLHLEHVLKSAKAKKAIFTEKPIGLTLEESDKVLKVVSASNVKFQIGFQRRWHPQYIKMKQIVDSGEMGRPLLFKAFGRDPSASNPSNWGLDKNGGLFLNAAIHDYDAARYILGSNVASVTATGETVVHMGLNEVGDVDTAITTLHMTNGTVAITEWSRYATYGYDFGAELICERGKIEISQGKPDGLSVVKENLQAPPVYEVFKDAYQNEIIAFLNAIKSNTTTSPGIEDARIGLQIALAARESYTKNSKILVPELPKI